MTDAASERTELMLRIFSDPQPTVAADAAYLFAETKPNQESVFLAGRELIEQGQVRRILISDCTAKSGYIGAIAYRAAMIAAGIPEGAIEEVPMEPTDIIHTRIEADAVIRFAKARRYESLLVVAVPFHQERAFISMATVALREFPSLKLHSHPGKALRWDEVVTHSQGTLRGTRARLIVEEQKRIDAYTSKGDLVPRLAVLKYLADRDR